MNSNQNINVSRGKGVVTCAVRDDGIGDLSHWFDIAEVIPPDVITESIKLVVCYETNKNIVSKRLKERGFQLSEFPSHGPEPDQTVGQNKVYLVILPKNSKEAHERLMNFFNEHHLEFRDAKYFISISTNLAEDEFIPFEQIKQFFNFNTKFIFCAEHGFGFRKREISPEIEFVPMGFGQDEYGVKLKNKPECNVHDAVKQTHDKNIQNLLVELGIKNDGVILVPCYFKHAVTARIFIKALILSPLYKNANKNIIFLLGGLSKENADEVVRTCNGIGFSPTVIPNLSGKCNQPVIVHNYFLDENDYHLMQLIAMNTGDVVGCSGDNSFEQACRLTMLPFYEMPMWKKQFLSGLMLYIYDKNKDLLAYFQFQLQLFRDLRVLSFGTMGHIPDEEQYIQELSYYFSEKHVQAWRQLMLVLYQEKNYYSHFLAFMRSLEKKSITENVNKPIIIRIKSFVKKAYQKYVRWYQDQNLVKSWFSLHGEEGQFRAKSLNEKIQQTEQLKDVYHLLLDHLTRPDARLREESFDTYLLKEIMSNKLLRNEFLIVNDVSFNDARDRERLRNHIVSILNKKISDLTQGIRIEGFKP